MKLELRETPVATVGGCWHREHYDYYIKITNINDVQFNKIYRGLV